MGLGVGGGGGTGGLISPRERSEILDEFGDGFSAKPRFTLKNEVGAIDFDEFPISAATKNLPRAS
jgi:hypothetical protein